MKIRLLALLSLLALVLSGMYATPAAFAQDEVVETAQLRVVHASPDAPPVDVYLNGEIVEGLTNVPYFTVSGYLTVPAAEYRVQVTPAGAGLDQAVIDTTVPLSPFNGYTLAATGFLSDIQPTLIEDDLSEISAVDARVTVYHFSPGAPNVDVKTLPDGAIILEDVGFGSSATDDIDGGTYNIAVTPAGAADPVVLNFPEAVLEDGSDYDIFAINPLESLAAEVVVNGSPLSTGGGGAPAPEPAPEQPAPEQPAPEPAPANAQVSVVHASPDAPNVDVYVDDAAALTDVPFFTASDYLDVPAGDRRVRIVPAGAPVEEAVLDSTFTLDANQAYTVAAVGLLENLQLVALEDDLSPAPAGQARVSVFHFSPDAPAVDILANGSTVSSGLTFGNGIEVDVPASTYDFTVVPTGATDPVISLPATPIEAGNFYSVYAVDTVANIRAELRVAPIGNESAEPAPAPAPTTPPAPEQPAPEQPPVPIQLPETAEGDTLPVGALALSALALLGLGVLTLSLRRRIS